MAISASSTRTKTHAMSSEDLAYLKMRLATQDQQHKASMEDCLKVNPGLTPEEYMEQMIAHGGLGSGVVVP